MRCIRIKLLLIGIFLLGKAFFVSAQESNLPDSLVTIENTYVFSLSEPQKAQQIIDRLRQLNDDKLAFDYEMDWAQGDLYFNTAKYRLASFYFEKTLGYEEVKSNRKFLMGLLSTMLECYRMKNDLEKTMETALRLLKITEADDIKEETGRAYMFMAEVFHTHGDEAQTKKYYDLAEQNLEEAGHTAYLYHFYMSYANTLAKGGEYAKALEIVYKAEKILPEVATDPYMMNEGYGEYEYCRFKAFATNILAKCGKTEKAREYYREFMSEDMGHIIENKILIVPYLLTAEKYNEAIAIAHEREEKLRLQADTIGDDMLAVKRYLSTAYNVIGMKDEAINYLRQELTIEEKLRSRLLNTATQELAVIYDTQKKDAELKEKEADVKFHRSLVFALSIISLLAIIIMVITIRNQRNTKRNNRLMAKQIKEMQVLRESQARLCEDDNAIEETSLFSQLERLMKYDKLYRDPVCNRELIINKLNIDKNTLLELQHANDIENLPDYINGFRLEEAIRLLDREKDLSIEQIAKQAGFGSSRSLQRQFKDKYNMSPGEYRKLAKEE